MKVKVSPPYEGAGSFEVEAYLKREGEYRMEFGGRFPESWCKEIPSVTPEPGDIVEYFDHKGKSLGVSIYRCSTPLDAEKTVVLARKVPEYKEAERAIRAFYCEFNVATRGADEQAAYDRFISAILGGGEYGVIK